MERWPSDRTNAMVAVAREASRMLLDDLSAAERIFKRVHIQDAQDARIVMDLYLRKRMKLQEILDMLERAVEAFDLVVSERSSTEQAPSAKQVEWMHALVPAWRDRLRILTEDVMGKSWTESVQGNDGSVHTPEEARRVTVSH